jgi:hypothetical protein
MNIHEYSEYLDYFFDTLVSSLSPGATSDSAIDTANLWKLWRGSELLVLLANYFEEIFEDLNGFQTGSDLIVIFGAILVTASGIIALIGLVPRSTGPRLDQSTLHSLFGVVWRLLAPDNV